ncbi:MAG TPA: phosphoribosylaminoimidazolesuccinocarboxamide synthase [Tepidisphaeraceae bacterium]|jgi:phosphoribosylaminoimidazole-succinocarboxamide synthase
MKDAVLETHLPFPKKSGKVRDVYDLGQTLLIVATDRISAFDVIMSDPIPGKGAILTALSLFWFEKFKQFENHLIATNLADYPQELKTFTKQIQGRSMLVDKAKVVPIECVARGYLAGSGWKEYQKTQTVCKIPLPSGLKQCSKLPKPIFTPATKEESGHDINISPAEMADRVGKELATELEKRTLSLYSQAADYAASKGIIIADTKFEFGLIEGGEIILIDEVLTPDSSRFWPADEYQEGRDQASFDKQFLRNWLEKQTWDKNPPAPRLPQDIISGTRQRYLEAYEKLVGAPLNI